MGNIERRGSRRRYPWARWFKKRRFILRKGDDYDCMPHSMAQIVRNVAAMPRWRLSVSISIDNEGTLIVKVLGPADDKKAG